MIAKVTEFLTNQGWAFSVGKRPELLLLSLSGQNGIYHCVIDDREDASRLLFISFMGTTCPKEKRTEMSELLTMINSNLGFGNFEMNNSGEIKFRTGIMYESLEITDKAISNIIFKNIDIMDFSHPFLLKFMFGTITIPEVYNSLYPPEQLPEKTQEALPSTSTT